jgi:hypothetical protein
MRKNIRDCSVVQRSAAKTSLDRLKEQHALNNINLAIPYLLPTRFGFFCLGFILSQLMLLLILNLPRR